MNVLVTGANGFVGASLCARLLSDGMYVRGVVRGAPHGAGFDPVVIDDIAAYKWDAALNNIDVVVHAAARVHIMRDIAADPMAAFRAVNVAGTQRLAEAARDAGVRRFVLVSSAKVHGEQTSTHPFTEEDPLKPSGPYAVSKWEAEQVLAAVAAKRMETVVLRPPLVYGPRVAGNFLSLLKAVARGSPLPLGAITNRRSMIYVENLTHAIARSVSDPHAAARVFLVSDGEDLSTSQLVTMLAAGLGVAPRLIPIPSSVLLFAGTLTGRRTQVERLTGSLQIDSTRIRQELGWLPPFSAAQGLAETAHWFRQEALRAAV